MAMPTKVQVVEVGPRDGFQMESRLIPTALKVAIVDLLSAAGLTKIEATSFVHPKVIPQMADAGEVLQRVARRERTQLTALVPNLQGVERAIAAGADGVRLVVCCTETYNQRNVGMSIADSVTACQRLVERAGAASLSVEVVLGVALGCPFEGEVDADAVVELARRFATIGIRQLCIADSIGVANPHQLRRLMSRLLEQMPDVAFSLHLHDTRGLGLTNVFAALELGIGTFDSSLGGLGGCPITTVSSGNIATEDLVNLCHEMGVETGIDLDRVREASRRVQSFLGRTLPSRVLAAGTREELFSGLD